MEQTEKIIKRKCATCKINKDIKLFKKNMRSSDGIARTCVICLERNKKWAMENKDKVDKYKKKWLSNNKSYRKQVSLRSHLNTKYNITLEEYEDMVEIQKGKCYICGLHGNQNTYKRLCLDHCHATGKIRKLLCTNCNKLIGFGRDNVEILKKCIDYLGE